MIPTSLKLRVDQAADSFWEHGVKKGDVVLCGVMNCMEAEVTLLALNKIGAISKWMEINNGIRYCGSNIEWVCQYIEFSPLSKRDKKWII